MNARNDEMREKKSSKLEELVINYAKKHLLDVIYFFFSGKFEKVKRRKSKVIIYFNGYSFEFTKKGIKIYFDICKRRVYPSNNILSCMYLLHKKLHCLWYKQEIRGGRRKRLRKKDRFIALIPYDRLDALEEAVNLVLYFDKLQETYKIREMMEKVLESFIESYCY